MRAKIKVKRVSNIAIEKGEGNNDLKTFSNFLAKDI